MNFWLNALRTEGLRIDERKSRRARRTDFCIRFSLFNVSFGPKLEGISKILCYFNNLKY